ncbi:MAG: alpha/beta fold hydrolase [Bryobacteraceae bacterium]
MSESKLQGLIYRLLNNGYNKNLSNFQPLFKNPHLLTIAANFWPRGNGEELYPAEDRLFETEPETRVRIRVQRPAGKPKGEVIFVHGLEGSSEAGYMRSASKAALEAGFVAHRFNLRTCGGTEALCRTMYHAGLTCDLVAYLRALEKEGRTPVCLAGYSLGGNYILKLAGELGADAEPLVAAMCTISTAVDLEAAAYRLAEPENWIYHMRFVHLLKQRLRRKNSLMPGLYPLDGIGEAKTLREFDNRFTSRFFGFRDAIDYYQTQSARRVVDRIRVPTLIIQAKDDPIIPFQTLEDAGVGRNPAIQLLATEHGGHMGFLSRYHPRFWSDRMMMQWFQERTGNKPSPTRVIT